MSSDQPKNLYRYRQFSATTIESLCHDNLYFSSPANFNDPLDCQPSVISDNDNKTLRKLLSELIKRRVTSQSIASLTKASIGGDRARNHAEKLGAQAAEFELSSIAYHSTNPEYECGKEEAENWLLTSEIESELLKQYDRGVCCFSSTVNNPLLWSHYGDQHHGLCIGYTLNRTPIPTVHKVEYGGNREVKTSLITKAFLEKDQKSQDKLDRDVLLRKASPWKYEREWRLIGDRGLQDSPLALVDVTFGLRCPVAIKHSVIKALESRSGAVKFYEIYRRRGSFNLLRRPVDTGEMQAFLPYTAMSGIEMFGELVTDLSG
ncbi:conserved hypothetical protein [Hahella chejuensis KCTC 2396]|uniref:DUF2971 domain-containing protein n=1 Tax=Hahella chejuensis (strain KCTC 2396) TaxID=349521 RepID=Q2SAM6_HAHCH|nr:DUF2971 domain-containing protein [Hahella chejuensis]ABC32298.1 conserved hypothetical protein [Hahella chejuensis KCTC 2396]